MRTYEDVKAEVANEHVNQIDLCKLVGKKVKEIQGSISLEISKEDPIFALYRVIFEDGSSLFVSRDATLDDAIAETSAEEMLNIYKTNPDFDPSEFEDTEE